VNISGISANSNVNMVSDSTVSVPNQSGFDTLWNTINNINTTQTTANSQVQDVITGKSDDTHGALIALEKAELQMQLANVVREKLTSGYQQIMNMQI
jgi:flagellar hook-basal body complex protein FliE